jgi:hypothetical protein
MTSDSNNLEKENLMGFSKNFYFLRIVKTNTVLDLTG